jgi:hypothetical protein
MVDAMCIGYGSGQIFGDRDDAIALKVSAHRRSIARYNFDPHSVPNP